MLQPEHYYRALSLAVRDRMTDALNKETFRERVIHRLDLAVPARQSFLLAILDLDDFKGLNNRHGHVAGDEVLRTFAQGARGIIRREDDFGRIGGDEARRLAGRRRRRAAWVRRVLRS